jgi:hypothetical protein
MTPPSAPTRLCELQDDLPNGVRQALEESAVTRLPTAQQLSDLEARLRDQLATPRAGTASAKLVLIPLVIAVAGAAALLSSTRRTPPPPAPHISAYDDGHDQASSAESAPEVAGPSAPQPSNDARSPGAALARSDPSRQGTTTDKPADARARTADRHVSDGPGEVELLARARRALASDPALAQRLVRDHERRFADGLLVEEREAIAVQALARAGALTQARSRALSFSARFPNSAYAGTVASVLEDATKAADAVPKR